jgi:serine-aspartate repeat-containing protein C/D/E
MSRAITATAITLAAIAAVASCGGGGDSTTEQPTHGSLSGKVIDTDSSNGGIGGVTLQLSSAAGASQSVTTGSNGTFTASNLDAGAYTIQMTTPANFLLAAGETGTRSATVVASASATTVTDFKLARSKGAVAGSVKNGSTGVGSAGLSLIRGGFATRSVTADASGNFTATQVPTGTWTLSISVPATLQLAAGESGSRTVSIAADQTTQTSAFNLTTRVAPANNDIQIIGTSFSPEKLTISAGTTVRWIGDGGTHTITPQNPNQPGVFERVQFSSPNVVLTHTFSVPGQVYVYRCEFHSDNFTTGMVGTITVQ